MFFKLLKREIVLTYLVWVLLVTLAVLMLPAQPGWQPERIGLGTPMARWPELSGLIPGLSLALYIILGWLQLTALSRLAARPLRRRDAVFHLLTSLLFSLLTLIAALAPYLMFRPLLGRLRDTAITEIPVVAGYLVLAGCTLLLLQAVHYLKLRTRILYFCLPEPSLRPATWFGGFTGRARTRGFLWFLLITSGFTGLPVLLFLAAVLLNSTWALTMLLTVILVTFAIGRYVLLYVIWNRIVP